MLFFLDVCACRKLHFSSLVLFARGLTISGWAVCVECSPLVKLPAWIVYHLMWFMRDLCGVCCCWHNGTEVQFHGSPFVLPLLKWSRPIRCLRWTTAHYWPLWWLSELQPASAHALGVVILYIIIYSYTGPMRSDIMHIKYKHSEWRHIKPFYTLRRHFLPFCR